MVLLAAVPPARADNHERPVTTRSADTVDLTIAAAHGSPAAVEAASKQTGHKGSNAAKPVTYIMAVRLDFDPVTGARCTYFYRIPGDPMGRIAAEYEQKALRWVGEFGTCSHSPHAPHGRPTPAQAALVVWREQVQLPAPVVSIAPGFALTGKPAYLEVTGPRRVGATFHALGQDVALDATSVLDVDWGDGRVETGLTRQGGPWPDGDISHVYIGAGPRTVTVTLRWHATWRVGRASGEIDEGLVTSAALPLEVRQLQAVRDR